MFIPLMKLLLQTFQYSQGLEIFLLSKGSNAFMIWLLYSFHCLSVSALYDLHSTFLDFKFHSSILIVYSYCLYQGLEFFFIFFPKILIFLWVYFDQCSFFYSSFTSGMFPSSSCSENLSWMNVHFLKPESVYAIIASCFLIWYFIENCFSWVQEYVCFRGLLRVITLLFNIIYPFGISVLYFPMTFSLKVSFPFAFSWLVCHYTFSANLILQFSIVILDVLFVWIVLFCPGIFRVSFLPPISFGLFFPIVLSVLSAIVFFSITSFYCVLGYFSFLSPFTLFVLLVLIFMKI